MTACPTHSRGRPRSDPLNGREARTWCNRSLNEKTGRHTERCAAPQDLQKQKPYGFIFLLASFIAPLASVIFFMPVSIFALAVSIFMDAIAESAIFAVLSVAIAGAGAGAIAGAVVSALGVSFVLQAATSTTATRARCAAAAASALAMAAPTGRPRPACSAARRSERYRSRRVFSFDPNRSISCE